MDLDFIKGFPESWQKEVDEYLLGKRKIFSVKPNLQGTAFQKAVWGEMLKIPYGETRTYTEIAKGIGNPKAVRAVGTACGKNPFPIIVPCHRVVAQNGLGGFSLGLTLKKQLLALEQQYK
jgi:O-6-methylguanine DNA methyltransferase